MGMFTVCIVLLCPSKSERGKKMEVQSLARSHLEHLNRTMFSIQAPAQSVNSSIPSSQQQELGVEYILNSCHVGHKIMWFCWKYKAKHTKRKEIGRKPAYSFFSPGLGIVFFYFIGFIFTHRHMGKKQMPQSLFLAPCEGGEFFNIFNVF